MTTTTPSPVSPDGARHRLDGASEPTALTAVEPDTTSYDDARVIIAHQEQLYGGVKWGSAFFGWVIAAGTSVLLAVPVAAVGVVAGLTENLSAQNAGTRRTAEIIAILVSLAVVFTAQFCGGYVAARMARFSGIRQGLAVWMFSVAIAVLVAVGVTVADAQLGLVDVRGALSALPIDVGRLATRGTAALLFAVGATAVALGAAVLGGQTGMRFHRRIDRDDIAQWDRYDEEQLAPQ
jgi:hypothetical protein